MSDGGPMILDGMQLSGAVDGTLPLPDRAVSETLTGALILELAESRASESLYGLALPDSLKSAVSQRLGIADEIGNFRIKELDRQNASSFLKDYFAAMADELKDDPIAVAVLDGQNLRLILEDEDDFAMLAENLFTDIDTEDRGKTRKSEIRNALAHMGIEMGIPPFSEFPELNDILKKHNAEGDEELGQAQFAELLLPVLQDLADALAAKHVTVVLNLKIVNGSKIRKLLGNQEQLDNVVEKLRQNKNNDNINPETCKDVIRSFLEENGKELGLPPLRADDMVVLLYDDVFADIEDTKKTAGSENSLKVTLKEILEKFAEQLEASPVFYDLSL